jgi:nicotinate-nucleotide adenylyltransferase
MRIAFFGGTFDPPHRGHLAIARAAAERLNLDTVWFAPVGIQPLKHGSSIASFEDRVAMVKLALDGDSRFAVSTEDSPRPDGKPNYTIDTLSRIRQSLRSEDKLFCLIGADSFLTMRNWYHSAELLLVCDFIIAARPGFDLQQVTEALPPGTRILGAPQLAPGLAIFQAENSQGRRSTLYLLSDLQEDISATEIREAFSEGKTENRVLTDGVAAYIRAHKLYC